MDSTPHKYDELLMSFLRGECSSKEAEFVRAWIDESDSNKQYFDSLKRIWDLSADFETDFDLDIDFESALSRINERIDNAERSEESPRHIGWFKRYYKPISVAAAVASVALIVAFFVNNKYNSTITIAASDWNIEEPYVLPDGSSVMMQQNAVMKYAKKFDGAERLIDFEGNAFFDVAHDETKPFVIRCGNMSVEVLGTSFDLSACPEKDLYELNLVTGKVSMTSYDKAGHVLDQTFLNPGERGLFSVSDGGFVHLNRMEVLKADAIESHVLDFNNAKLSEVIESLEFIYDLDIELDERYADYRLTARLEDESVESVLETIAAVFGFSFEKDGTRILIK